LEKEVDAIVIFKNTHASVQEKDQIFEDSVSQILKNPDVSNYAIYSNQINRNDPSNLLAWAQSLDTLTKNNKVFKKKKFVE